MPYRDIAAAALRDWRNADRLMSELEHGSEAWLTASRDADDAKARYEAAVAAAQTEHRPEPPPFDEARQQLIAGEG